MREKKREKKKKVVVPWERECEGILAIREDFKRRRVCERKRKRKRECEKREEGVFVETQCVMGGAGTLTREARVPTRANKEKSQNQNTLIILCRFGNHSHPFTPFAYAGQFSMSLTSFIN